MEEVSAGSRVDVVDSVPGGGGPPRKLMIQTHDLCMICLKKSAPMKTREDILICRTLSRYFGFNLKRIAKVLPEELETWPAIIFPMCEQCRMKGNKFVAFYRRMEVIKMQLDEMGQEICDLVDRSDKPSILSEQNIMKNVRMVLKTKCTKKITSCLPLSNRILPQPKVVLRDVLTDNDILWTFGSLISLWIVIWLALMNPAPRHSVNTKHADIPSVTAGPSSNSQDLENDLNKSDPSLKRNPTETAENPSRKRVKPSRDDPLGGKPEASKNKTFDSSKEPAGKPVQRTPQRMNTCENQCPLCKEKFSIRGLLEKHRAVVHHFVKYVKCARCDLMLSSYHALECHREDHPDCEVSLEEKRKEKLTIACPQFPFAKVIKGNLFCPEWDCYEVFDEQHKVDHHIKTHGTFKCGLGCSRPNEFPKAHWLAIHEFVKHGRKVNPSDIQCPRCRLTFTSKHEYIHHFVTEHLKIIP